MAQTNFTTVRRAAFSVFIWLFVLAAAHASAHPNSDDGPVQLAHHVHVLPFVGTNIGIIEGETSLAIIDPGFEESDGPRFLAALREISKKPIRYVLNTHDHWDHSAGNSFLASQGALVIGHENSRYSSAYVEQTFGTSLRLQDDGMLFELFHMRSHSYSDVIIHLPAANVVFMGDTFTNTGHPTFYSGGIAKQKAVVERVLAISDKQTKIVPGHGTVSDQEGLARYQRQTNALYEHLKTLVLKGVDEPMIQEDDKYRSLMLAFSVTSDLAFLDQMGVRRFVSRVSNSDLLETVRLNDQEIAQLVGIYEVSDGSMYEVIFEDGALFLRQEGGFIAELLPITKTNFRMRAYSLSEVTVGSPLSATPHPAISIRFGNTDPVNATRRKPL